MAGMPPLLDLEELDLEALGSRLEYLAEHPLMEPSLWSMGLVLLRLAQMERRGLLKGSRWRGLENRWLTELCPSDEVRAYFEKERENPYAS